MKQKMIVIVLIVMCLICAVGFLPVQQKEYDYLRLHIRANSNSTVDQNVKYKIKAEMVNFLTPYFCQVKSKQNAIDIVNNLKPQIEEKCNNILADNGFDYKTNVKINNEYFPTRSYANTTLESGYYDAVIVELGTAQGDNWWCVMYPPLCFVSNQNSGTTIKCESRIINWIRSIFN